MCFFSILTTNGYLMKYYLKKKLEITIHISKKYKILKTQFNKRRCVGVLWWLKNCFALIHLVAIEFLEL
jgi:hypothetical protein